jgi:hypothetical protein
MDKTKCMANEQVVKNSVLIFYLFFCLFFSVLRILREHYAYFYFVNLNKVKEKIDQADVFRLVVCRYLAPLALTE